MAHSHGFRLTLLLLVVLSPECIFVSTCWPNPTTVSITNLISENTTLYLQCKSADDDLGPHVLSYKQSFMWKFTMNQWRTTLYWCSMSWVDTNGNELYGSGVVYKKKQVKHCTFGHNCPRVAKIDGLWATNFNDGSMLDMLFPWSRK